ncbi:tetratricopeptide repeat protein [Zoogloea sp. LCSB751]|uniref:nuclear transport factor 2 family protein n=1 Tax=Zoogloea sp. LCSB751 TaxID=1965277 RepID=UPI0009A4E55E|nr:tetratricopeptide repeat protein [Zoogloea sp. LCSB751]
MSKRALAAALFLHALLCSPVQAESVQELQVLLKQGQFARVVERSDALLASKPRDVQLRFLKGVALAELNRNSDAIAVFQKLTEDYPDLPEPYNNLAVLYAQQKQYDKARAALETAIRTHPSYATAHENLGDIYARLASQAYDKALSLDSSNAAAQSKLSMIREIMSISPAKAIPQSPVAAPPTSLPARPAAPPPVAPPAPKPTPAVATAPATTASAIATKEEPKLAPKRALDTAEDSAHSSAAVTKVVQSWATAWSRKDVKGYLAHYARDFEPPKGQNRKTWEDERSQRLSKPGEIEVGIENLKIVGIDNNRATVKLRQNYRSANLSSSSGKTLVLIWQDGKWLIQQERVGN